MSREEYLRRLISYIKIADNDLKAKLEEFKALSSYVSGAYDNGASFDTLNKYISEIEAHYQTKKCNRLFYIALPPSVRISVAENLKKHCYVINGINRIVLEQPFGNDLDSSSELTGILKQYWTEDETFRIDHFLGKEMVRNILSLRFANIALPSNATWDKNSIANVQINFGESFGTEGRGGYFDKIGIIRDVMQNRQFCIGTHMLSS
jgi:glucose-6-phosphate 1-dehydrogenase